MLNNNQVQKAEEMMKFFRSNLSDGNPYELQNLWYEVCLVKALLRRKEYGKAFRIIKILDKHFDEVHDDPIDFHFFAIVKYRLRSFVELIQYNDKVRQNLFFLRAAALFTKYIPLY